jgi:rRNA maturation endonuclease Nob1
MVVVADDDVSKIVAPAGGRLTPDDARSLVVAHGLRNTARQVEVLAADVAGGLEVKSWAALLGDRMRRLGLHPPTAPVEMRPECPECGGTGNDNKPGTNELIQCPACGGTGLRDGGAS